MDLNPDNYEGKQVIITNPTEKEIMVAAWGLAPGETRTDIPNNLAIAFIRRGCEVKIRDPQTNDEILLITPAVPYHSRRPYHPETIRELGVVPTGIIIASPRRHKK